MLKRTSTLTCGSCSGLTREKLVSGTKCPCSGVGKLPSSKICSYYRTDVFSLSTVETEESENALGDLAKCIKTFSVKELQTLASLLLHEKQTRKYKLHFWQKVYFRIRGTSSDMYFNNFVEGRILDANKEYVRVVSETGKTCVQLVNIPGNQSFYTVDEFKPLRKQMSKHGLLVDPKTLPEYRSRVPQIETLDYAISTSLITEDFSKGKKARKSDVMDLTSIVKRMASGHILKKTRSDSDDEIVIRRG